MMDISTVYGAHNGNDFRAIEVLGQKGQFTERWFFLYNTSYSTSINHDRRQRPRPHLPPFAGSCRPIEATKGFNKSPWSPLLTDEGRVSFALRRGSQIGRRASIC